MRWAATGLFLFSVLAVAAVAPRDPAGATQNPPAGGATAGFHQSTQPIDQHDGSRVGVQLVVAGIAAGFVVGAGSAAYLLRRKLGRTAYAPDQAADAHH